MAEVPLRFIWANWSLDMQLTDDIVIPLGINLDRDWPGAKRAMRITQPPGLCLGAAKAPAVLRSREADPTALQSIKEPGGKCCEKQVRKPESKPLHTHPL